MRRGVAIILPVLAVTARLAAQGAETPQDGQAPTPTFPAEVEQVVVDAVVTDGKGDPVGGLTREDLIVTEDGERQTIESFEAIELPAEPVPMEPPPPRISVNTAPEARRGRTFVVVFDDLNITPFRARDAKAAVASFLENGVREGDFVTLIATSGEAWWTARMSSGREKLLEIVKRLEGLLIPDQSMDRMTDWEAMQIHVRRDRNVAARVYRRFQQHGVVLDRSAQSDADPLTVMTEDPFVTSRAAEVYYDAQARNRSTLDVLERALNALAGARGRKSVILVSEGFIYDPDLEEFKHVGEASLRANAAIYFINARGLEAMPTELTSPFGPALPQVDLGFVFHETYEAVEGPESIASDSGGFTVRNTNDLASGIQRIAAETRIYYLLGYTPTNRARDGTFRRIEVKLRDGKGLRVRARKGYYAPTADGRREVPPSAPGVDPAFQAALDSPWAEDAIPLRMTHYVGRETTPGKVSVLVATEVDIRDFDLERVDDRFVGAIEFLLVVTHRESGEFFRYDQRIDMDMLPATRERLMRLWFPIVRDFELQPGDHQAKMIVREAATGRVGSVVHEFSVPPPEQFRVSTPIVTDLYHPKPEGRGVVPQVLARREFPRGSALLCQFEVFGAARDEAGMPRVVEGHEVRRSDGMVFADVPESVINPTSLGALTRLVAFPLRDATPGEYEIRLHFRDELAGTELELREPFTVVPPAPAAGPDARSGGGANAGP
jgi:VWFA-related protein